MGYRFNSVLTVPQFGFITGASGSGKNRGVGSILSEYWPVEIFVSGDWCREHQAEHAKNGILIRDDTITDAGIEFYREKLALHNGEIMHFLFDAPRTLEQAKKFLRLFEEWGCKSIEDVHTFDLRTSPKTAWDRIVDRATRQHRLDDKDPVAVARRLSYYFGNKAKGWEAPDNLIYSGEGGVLNDVIPWMQENTTYHLIDGERDLDLVRVEMHQQIGRKVFGMIEA